MENESTKPQPKRIYRSRQDRMLGGVAGGLGAYFGIDPVLVRIAFVALAFAGGSGVLLYLIAWIVIPEAPAGDRPTTEPPSGTMGAQLVIGSILVAMGVFFLIDGLVMPVRRFLVPMVIILVGLAIMAAGRSRS